MSTEPPLNFNSSRGNPQTSVDCWKQCYRTALSIAEVFVLPTVSHSTCSFAGTKLGNDGVDLGLIRFRGHFPKGGYDVHTDGRDDQESAVTPTVR